MFFSKHNCILLKNVPFPTFSIMCLMQCIGCLVTTESWYETGMLLVAYKERIFQNFALSWPILTYQAALSLSQLTASIGKVAHATSGAAKQHYLPITTWIVSVTVIQSMANFVFLGSWLWLHQDSNQWSPDDRLNTFLMHHLGNKQILTRNLFATLKQST